MTKIRFDVPEKFERRRVMMRDRFNPVSNPNGVFNSGLPKIPRKTRRDEEGVSHLGDSTNGSFRFGITIRIIWSMKTNISTIELKKSFHLIRGISRVPVSNKTLNFLMKMSRYNSS